jgi:hypothetical protein
MKRTCLPRLATPAEVARVLGVPLHRVLYVLRSRPHILPRAIAGAARCFDDGAIAQVRHELARIERDRQGGTP